MKCNEALPGNIIGYVLDNCENIPDCTELTSAVLIIGAVILKSTTVLPLL